MRALPFNYILTIAIGSSKFAEFAVRKLTFQLAFLFGSPVLHKFTSPEISRYISIHLAKAKELASTVVAHPRPTPIFDYAMIRDFCITIVGCCFESSVGHGWILYKSGSETDCASRGNETVVGAGAFQEALRVPLPRSPEEQASSTTFRAVVPTPTLQSASSSPKKMESCRARTNPAHPRGHVRFVTLFKFLRAAEPIRLSQAKSSFRFRPNKLPG